MLTDTTWTLNPDLLRAFLLLASLALAAIAFGIIAGLAYCETVDRTAKRRLRAAWHS